MLVRVKAWMAACVTERTGDGAVLGIAGADVIINFEKALQSGYLLARLAGELGGPACQGHIYPVSLTCSMKREVQGWLMTSLGSQSSAHAMLLTDNVQLFFNLLREHAIPEEQWFETLDLLEGRNMPRVIYAVLALAMRMETNGHAPGVPRLRKHVRFSRRPINARDLLVGCAADRLV